MNADVIGVLMRAANLTPTTLSARAGLSLGRTTSVLAGGLWPADPVERIALALRGIATPRRAGVTRICERCHVEFATFPSYEKRGRGRFCSRACQAAANLAANPCQFCGVPAQCGRRYCSPCCRKASARQRTVGHFWRSFDKTEGGCWIWRGRAEAGYGLAGKTYAHRLSWELHRGAIPAGLHIDHLCFVKTCVNPDHLELVTGAENARRYQAARSAGTLPAWHPAMQRRAS